MLRIAIGGLKKAEMERAIKEAGKDRVEVIVTNDVQGAQMIKRGEADYYFGACQSGGGAAISLVIGILGYNKCGTVAKLGAKPNKESIEKMVEEGKLAFGMAVENISTTVPIIIDVLLSR